MVTRICYLPHDESLLHQAFELLRLVYDRQPPAWPMGGAWTRSLLKSEMEAGSLLCGFNAQDQMVGFILYRHHLDAREISLAVTRPDSQRSGVMRSLFRHLKSQLKAQDEIWLEVHEKNQRALDFYLSEGFEQKGRRASYYRDGGAAILLSYCHQ